MNKNDSDIIAHILKSQGAQVVSVPHIADVFVVNTCSVRAHAEARALGFICSLKKWRGEKDRALCVVGCMAKRLGNKIFSYAPFVDLILGPDSYRDIGNYINSLFIHKSKIIEINLDQETYCGIYHRSNAVCDFVSIMRGCNNFCSYCVVPYLRGCARSRPIDDIINEIAYLTACGVKDIMLLGQNVNEYSYNGFGFADLLNRLSEIPGVFRLRFLTSHPKDLDDATIATVKKNKKICEWFHLPLQSGSNRILQLMNRHYTVEDYLNLIDKIKVEIPSATITTDIIVGFPTETEDEFLKTLSILAKIKFNDAYMYRYSVREGTEAANYEPLPEEVIKNRLKRLINFQNNITVEKMKEMIGQKFEVLFEGKAKKGGIGKTRGNIPVIIERDGSPGEVYNVIIRTVKGKTPIGEIIKNT